MRRLFTLTAFLGALLAFQGYSWGQANLPNNPNAETVQGPDPTGQQGYPLATVPATGALPWPVSGTTAADNQLFDTLLLGYFPWYNARSMPGTVDGLNLASTGLYGQFFSTDWGPVRLNQNSMLEVDGSGVTQPVSGTVTVQSISNSVDVTQGTSPWVVGFNGVSQPVTVGNFPATQPVSGTVTANQGTSPWVISGTVTSTPSGTQSVQGTLTNNNAAPGANNVGVLPAIANAVAPTLTEGDQTLLSTDLTGRQRTLDNHSSVRVTASFTRPANTTSYATNSYMSNSTTSPTVLTFSGCARVSGGSGKITSITIIDEANQSTKLAGLLLLFDSPVTAHNDGTVSAESNADVEHLIATISFGGGVSWQVTNAGSGASGNVVLTTPAQASLISDFQCANGSTNLYAILLTTGAYTPVSGEKFVFRLGITQD